MRVWQPGSTLVSQRKVVVDDWSWAATRRRLTALYRLARPYRGRVALAALTLIAATAAALAAPLLIGAAVNQVSKKHPSTANLGPIVAAFVGISVVGVVCSYGQTYFTGWTGERMLADLRNHLFRHLQRLSLGFYERNRAGVLVSRLTNDVEALDQLVTDGVVSLLQNTLTLVGAAVLMFILSWQLALATLTIIPPLVVGTAIFRKKSSRSYRLVRETLGAVTATLAEDIAGMRVLQAFTREEAARENFRLVGEAYRRRNQETVIQNALYFPYVDLLSSLATAIILGFGAYLVFDTKTSYGVLAAFLGYAAMFFDPVQQLSQLYSTFLSAVAALDKIMEVLVEEPQVTDKAGSRALPRLRGRVRFDHVRFGYGTGAEVLHGIDLDVPAGSTVALVGHTGAGKSTIAKLLARFYDPTEGAILVDGIDLRETTQESLRRQLGIVPQEGFLFAGTVAENIVLGRPDASREEMAAAARAVGADTFIEALEGGYDTGLGERGFRLSLGQRQLVAFARALLADPSILILDEATSSVDIATERRIEHALRRLLRGRTAFVIAHRLSTVRGADLIVVLEHGLVVERGTHDELIACGGRYAELYGSWVAAPELDAEVA
jgi:ABC-type multidrug transport system fused ATPase/permease subunit